MTSPQPEEQGDTAPIELPSHQQPTSPPTAASPEPTVAAPVPQAATAPAFVSDGLPAIPPAPAATPAQQEVTYVPLAVTVGDGFKFGCGFFIAMVIAALVAFVLLAALVVVSGLFGLNLPLSR